MFRRVIGCVVTLSALAVASGCGGNGADTTVRSDRAGHRDAVAVAAGDNGAVNAAGLRTVTYQGVKFDVPASWPVYDLAANPSTCVRFDVNAVYLGHPGADMACPAGLVGRADAVLVEPSDGTQQQQRGGVASADVAATQAVNDLQAQVVDGGAASSEVDATFPAAGISATLTYRDSDAVVRQILGTFRSAS